MKRFLFIVVRLFFLTPGLMILQCSFQTPSAPNWDVTMVVPLIDKTYTMIDAQDDTDHLTIDETNNEVEFNFKDDFSTSVARALRVDVQGDNNQYPFNQQTPDSAQVTGGVQIVGTAIIDSAYLDLVIDNRDNPFPAWVMFTTIDLYDPLSFSPYQFFLEVQPNTLLKGSYLIENAAFIPPTYDGKSYLRYTVEPTGGSDDQGIYVDFSLQDLDFTTLPGIFESVEIKFKDVDFDLPIPEEVEGFRIGDAQFTIVFTEQIGIPVEFQFIIQGEDFRSNPADPITIEETLRAAPPTGIRIDSLQFSGPEIVDFINSQPEHINISGTLHIGDGSFATINEDDSLKGDFIFETPLIFALEQRTNYSDVDTISLDEDAVERIRDNLIEISIQNVITNHLPVGAGLSLYFSNSRNDSTLYDSPDLIIGPLELAPATLSDVEPVVVLQPGVGTWDQALGKSDDIAVFEHEDIYFGIKYEFYGTQNKLAKIRPSDYIHINMVGSVKINTTVPEDEDSKGGQS